MATGTKCLVSLSTCILLLHTACEYAPDRDRDAQYSSEHLQAVVDEYLKDKTNILGTIVQVDIQGTESYRAASGFTDSLRTVPIEPDTRFIIGSVTKTFTAALVHQAIEKGQVQGSSAPRVISSPSTGRWRPVSSSTMRAHTNRCVSWSAITNHTAGAWRSSTIRISACITATGAAL